MTYRRRLAHIGLLASLVLSLSLQAGTTIDEQVQAVVRQAIPAFVFISRKAGGSGSGAVISPDGYAITNQHVVGDEIDFNVRLGNGQSYTAKVVGRDRQGDLALMKLKTDEKLPYIKFGDSDKLKVGDPCIAIGNPLAIGLVDQTPTVSRGVISGLHQYRGRGRYNDAVVTDAPINPGNSGGPLLNLRGELVGVNGLVETRIGLRSNTGLGYAIPANQVKAWVPVLKDPKRLDVWHGRLLGLKFETDTKKAPQFGVLVTEVEEGSDAAKIGFQAGDLIFESQGYTVWNASRFAGVLGIYPAGTQMTTRLIRQGQTVELTYKLEERRPAKLGFSIARPGARDPFIRVGKVDPKSAAAKAGLKAKDEIIAIGKQALGGLAQVQYAIVVRRWMPRLIAGSKITLTVRRRENQEIVEKEITFIAD